MIRALHFTFVMIISACFGFHSLADVDLPVGSNWQSIVNSNPAGTTYRIASGVHRLQSVTPKDGDTFIGEVDSIMKGSKIITGAIQDGGSQRWYFPNQTQALLWFNSTDPLTRQMACGNDLFIDDVRQQHAESISAVNQTGEYYFDSNANRIYVYGNPAGKTVEAVVQARAFNIPNGIDDVTLENFTITHYGPPIRPVGVIVAEDSDNLTLRYMDISWNHGSSIRTGDGTQITNCRFAYNGQIGLIGDGGNLYIGSCEFVGNGFHVPLGGEKGAMKIASTTSATVENCWVYDNDTFGIWFDIDNHGATIRSNLVQNNIRNIYWEISGLGTPGALISEIYWNICESGSATTGVMSNNSSNVDIYENLLKCSVGLSIRDTDRPESRNAQGLLENVRAWGNRIQSTFRGVQVEDQTGNFEYITLLNNNTYVGANAYDYDGSNNLSFTSWRNISGYDLNSTYSSSGNLSLPSGAVAFQPSPYGPQAAGSGGGSVNFNTVTISSYDNQDVSGGASVQDGGDTLYMSGNTWKLINFPVNITADTVLEFDFRSTIEGEIHAIGFDSDTTLSESQWFQLHGTTPWGTHQNFNNYAGGGSWVHYTIPVGEFFTGSMQYMSFINDHDGGAQNGNGYFRNVTINGGSSGGNVNFNGLPISSYDNQDVSGGATIQDGGANLHLSGNTWKLVTFPVSISADTVLEFDFRSDIEGEIHAIGFDNDTSLSESQWFQLHGTTPWGTNQSYNNYSGTGWVHYEIPVGQYFTGSMQYLSFINDHDASPQNASGYFRNVVVSGAGSGEVVFNSQALSSYDNQDVSGGATVQDGGATLHLSGNTWKLLSYTYTVTPNTVLEFDFRSDIEGEIHAIGLDNDTSLSESQWFQLHGTTPWGTHQDYNNYSGTSWIHYTIPVGTFFTGSMQYLSFINDHDASPQNASAYFSNVILYED